MNIIKYLLWNVLVKFSWLERPNLEKWSCHLVTLDMGNQKSMDNVSQRKKKNTTATRDKAEDLRIFFAWKWWYATKNIQWGNINICKILFRASEISEHRFKFSTDTRYYLVPVIFFISIRILLNFRIFLTTFETFIGSETKRNGTIFLPRLGKTEPLVKVFTVLFLFEFFHSVTKSFNKSRNNADN